MWKEMETGASGGGASEVVLKLYNNGQLTPDANEVTIQATTGYKILAIFVAEQRTSLQSINRAYYFYTGLWNTTTSNGGVLSATYSTAVTYANDRKSATIGKTSNYTRYIAWLEVPENTDLSTIDDFINS